MIKEKNKWKLDDQDLVLYSKKIVRNYKLFSCGTIDSLVWVRMQDMVS